MELLEEVIQVYIERKEWFGELMLQHMTLSAIAIFFAGIIGLLIGMWIAEHNRVAPVILEILIPGSKVWMRISLWRPEVWEVPTFRL